MKFGGETSKNIHDVRRVCLETFLCDLVCFIKLYVFVLDEINVRGPKLVKNIFGLETSGKTPKDQLRVLEEGPIV